MGRKRYNLRNDFLPRYGSIFVDTSGPKWTPSGRNKMKSDIVRLASFNRVLKKRGNVLASQKILEEVRRNVDHFMKYGEEAKKRMSRHIEKHGECVRGSGFLERIDFNRVASGEHSRLYDILAEGRSSFDCVRGEILEKDVVDFYREFDIQPPDRELVSVATFYRGVNGILSADEKLMGAYVAGLKEFGIGGFVCDSRFAIVDYVSVSRIVR